MLSILYEIVKLPIEMPLWTGAFAGFGLAFLFLMAPKFGWLPYQRTKVRGGLRATYATIVGGDPKNTSFIEFQIALRQLGSREKIARDVLTKFWNTWGEAKRIANAFRGWLRIAAIIADSFVLLGILGTLIAILTLPNKTGGAVAQAVSKAVSTTVVGIIATIVAKFYYEFRLPALEDVETELELVRYEAEKWNLALEPRDK